MYKIEIWYRIPSLGVNNSMDLYTNKKLGEVESGLKDFIRFYDANFEGAKDIVVSIMKAEKIDGEIFGI